MRPWRAERVHRVRKSMLQRVSAYTPNRSMMNDKRTVNEARWNIIGMNKGLEHIATMRDGAVQGC